MPAKKKAAKKIKFEGTPEELQKMAAELAQEHFKLQVEACSKAIYKQVTKFPVNVSVQALEIIYEAAVAHIGDEELAAWKRHIEQFHAELKMIQLETPQTRTLIM